MKTASQALEEYAEMLAATLPIANSTLTVDAAIRGVIEELHTLAQRARQEEAQ